MGDSRLIWEVGGKKVSWGVDLRKVKGFIGAEVINNRYHLWRKWMICYFLVLSGFLSYLFYSHNLKWVLGESFETSNLRNCTTFVWVFLTRFGFTRSISERSLIYTTLEQFSGVFFYREFTGVFDLLNKEGGKFCALIFKLLSRFIILLERNT